ncbi:hypothetical protein M1146_05815 [Patescibacteria group bacterium]|nr:hypothetical protein [Patescibacteria group bacterium]
MDLACTRIVTIQKGIIIPKQRNTKSAVVWELSEKPSGIKKTRGKASVYMLSSTALLNGALEVEGEKKKVKEG